MSTVDPKTINEELKEWLSCSLCQKAFTSPKLLRDCRHTFCKACLETYVASNTIDQRFPCPTCNRKATLPGSGAAGFPTHKLYEKIYDFMQPMHVRKKTEMKCSKHKEDLKHFCTKEEVPICSVCKERDHKDHKVIKNIDLANGDRKDFGTTSEKMRVRKAEMQKAWRETDDYETNFTVAKNNAEQDIRKRADELHVIINNQRDQLLRDLKKTFNNKTSELQHQKTDLQLKMFSYTGLREFMLKLIEHGSDVEVVKFKKMLIDDLKFALAASIPEVKQTQITFTSAVLTPEQVYAMYGIFSKVVVPRVVTGKEITELSVTTTRTPLDTEEPSLAGFEIKANGDMVVSDSINKTVKFFGKSGKLLKELRTSGEENGVGEPRDICVMKDSNLAIVDRSDKTIKIFAPDGEFIRSFRNDEMKNPCGVVINDEESIYVTDKDQKCIFVHNNKGELLSIIKEDGGKPLFTSPWYVTVNNDNNLIVSDLDAHVIKILTPKGQLLHEYGKGKGSGEGEMSYPWGVAVDKYGYIFVADYWNNRIHLLTQDGKFKCFVVSTGISRPVDVDITPDGYLAVAECSGSIRIYAYLFPWEENGSAPPTRAPSAAQLNQVIRF